MHSIFLFFIKINRRQQKHSFARTRTCVREYSILNCIDYEMCQPIEKENRSINIWWERARMILCRINNDMMAGFFKYWPKNNGILFWFLDELILFSLVSYSPLFSSLCTHTHLLRGIHSPVAHNVLTVATHIDTMSVFQL